jgi:hypothetical protein
VAVKFKISLWLNLNQMEQLDLLTNMVSKGRNALNHNNKKYQTNLNELEDGLQDIYKSFKQTEKVFYENVFIMFVEGKTKTFAINRRCKFSQSRTDFNSRKRKE